MEKSEQYIYRKGEGRRAIEVLVIVVVCKVNSLWPRFDWIFFNTSFEGE